MYGIARRFIDAFHVTAIEDHAGRAGVNEPVDAKPAAGIDHDLGAGDVDTVIVAIASADARLCGDMEHDVAASDGPLDGIDVGDVGLRLIHAERIKGGMGAGGTGCGRVRRA